MTKDLVLCGSALTQDDKVSAKIFFLPQHTRTRNLMDRVDVAVKLGYVLSYQFRLFDEKLKALVFFDLSTTFMRKFMFSCR